MISGFVFVFVLKKHRKYVKTNFYESTAIKAFSKENQYDWFMKRKKNKQQK